VPPASPGASPSTCPNPRPGGGRCRARCCPSCGVLWAGDTRVKLLAAADAYGEDVALVTVTAPGSDQLPWDGSRVDDRAAWRWNASAPPRWSRLHRAAAQRTRRRTGHPFKLVSGTWEDQKRGVLHRHLVVPMATPADRHASNVYAQELSRLAGAHGFGHVDRGRRRHGVRQLERVPAGHAASYVSKYLAKGLVEVAKLAEAPSHLAYAGRHLTAISGVTMRTLRLRRLAWHLARERGICPMDALEALLEAPPSRWLRYRDLDAAAAALGP
jgi:hypothetical protein